MHYAVRANDVFPPNQLGNFFRRNECNHPLIVLTDLDGKYLMGVEELTWAVGELAAMSTDHFEVDDLLRRLCEVAATSLPADGVGVMKIDTDAATRFVHASDPPLTGLEQLQEQRQEGPGRDAIDTGQVVVAATIAQMRWPAFQQVARAL